MAAKNCVLNFKRLYERVNVKNRRLNMKTCPLPPLTGGMETEEREWRNLSSETLRGFCFSPYITTVIKSRMVRWAGHVARVGERQRHTEFRRGFLKEQEYLKTYA
jgi:hypothetical protein